MRLFACICLTVSATLARAQSGLLLRYPLTETSGNVANDASGNGRHGTIMGGPEMTGVNGLRLDGRDDYVKLPNDLMRGLTAITISIQVNVRTEQSGNYFIFGLGRTGSDGDGDGYIFATGNPLRAAITPGHWEVEAESRSGSNLQRNTWKTVTYVVDSRAGTSILYLDGRQVAAKTSNSPIISPGSIGGGTTQQNYIGRSQYTADNYLAGSVRDFRIYNRALSTPEVVLLLAPAEPRIDTIINSLTITNLNDVRGNLYLPKTLEEFSINWGTSNPAVISTDGVVDRQDIDTQVTLLAVIDHDGEHRERTFTATVRRKPSMGVFAGYVFAYFTGDSRAGEAIYMAASQGNNALQWRTLRRAQPLLTSTMGTTGLRDPFIIRSPEGDTFYMIATDLSTPATSWSTAVKTGSRYIEVWESHDLVTWSAQRHVLVSPETAGNTWAPEAYYDDSLGSYVVFWASSLYGEQDTAHSGTTYHRMMYSTTRDFVNFSPPQVWQDAGMSRIDSTVIKANGVYYRFTKDEGARQTGCTDIIEEKSTSLTAPLQGWSTVATCIAKNAGANANVEGPSIFKSNLGDVNGEKYYLFVDEYTGRGYVPLETTNITAGRWTLTRNFNLPANPRHGSVIPVTAEELANVVSRLG